MRYRDRLRFGDMDRYLNRDRHLHRDLDRVRNLLHIYWIRFGYFNWVKFYNFDFHRNLHLIWNFLDALNRIGLRDGVL
jgi:hypothetical protein